LIADAGEVAKLDVELRFGRREREPVEGGGIGRVRDADGRDRCQQRRGARRRTARSPSG